MAASEGFAGAGCYFKIPGSVKWWRPGIISAKTGRYKWKAVRKIPVIKQAGCY